jgi:hypothetical protein
MARLFTNMEFLMPQHLPHALPVSEGIVMLTDIREKKNA